MQTRTFSSYEEALAVAKEALWLAWQAVGGTGGMGIFQDNPGADKEAVWDNAYNQRDYAGGRKETGGGVNADYVFGRMMKLRFTIENSAIEFPDFEPRRDYQAWCGKYKSFAALFDAAADAVVQKAA